MNPYRDIPEHEHTHSVYTLCLDCHMWGINTPVKFIDGSQCGNCQSINTVKYYPSCCIMADRTIVAQEPNYKAMLIEQNQQVVLMTNKILTLEKQCEEAYCQGFTAARNFLK